MSHRHGCYAWPRPKTNKPKSTQGIGKTEKKKKRKKRNAWAYLQTFSTDSHNYGYDYANKLRSWVSSPSSVFSQFQAE